MKPFHLLLESDKDEFLHKESLFHIHSIGCSDESIPHFFKQKSLMSDYLFTLILQGEMRCFDVSNPVKHIKCKENDLILFKPDEEQIHFSFVEDGNTNIKRIWFHAIGTSIPNILQDLGFTSSERKISLSNNQAQSFYEKFTEITKLIQVSRNNNLQLTAKIFDMLSSCCDSSIDTVTPAEHSTFDKSIEYLNKNFKQDIDIQTLADIAGVSKYYYISLFRKYFFQTPYKYITIKRLKSAANDLCVTDDKIEYIALKNGFNNRTHFSQTFKKFYNYTPAEFRKNHSLKYK